MNVSPFQKAPWIPQQAFDLMRRKTVGQVYADMIENRGLPLIEALTFCGIYTPIIYNKTGDVAGYVIYWIEFSTSASYKVSENEWLHLTGIEDKRVTEGGECVEMYEKFLHIPESSCNTI